MKVIIINDLNSRWETVIPYGLNLAKMLEAEADVLHVIDSRMNQAQYTSYSDSQSITPGSTLSQDEVNQRERNHAELEMDKVLSAEASRLNYPLKVNRIVVENSMEDELIKRADENKNSLFVISSEPDSYMFESKDDILSTLEDTGVPVILVPPRIKFREYKRALLPVRFEDKKFEAYRRVSFLFENSELLVNAVSVASEKNYTEMEAKSGSWKKVAEEHFLKSMVRTNMLEGSDYAETLYAYIERNQHDIILLFEPADKPNTLLSRKHIINLLNDTKIPVLLYYYR